MQILIREVFFCKKRQLDVELKLPYVLFTKFLMGGAHMRTIGKFHYGRILHQNNGRIGMAGEESDYLHTAIGQIIRLTPQKPESMNA